MSAEPAVAIARPKPRLRTDLPPVSALLDRVWPWVALALLGTCFVLIGGANLELGPIEARLGLSAGEPLGPFGQVYGGWEPATWLGQLAPSVFWARAEGGQPAAGAVRWPSALAGVGLGLLLARRLMRVSGPRAGVLLGVCWFGSLALIDRSAGTGIDLVAGLGTVAALDRIIGAKSDALAGLWTALAVLAGGWPPLAVIALATIVIGRREAALSAGLLAPPIIALAAWSSWALRVAPAEAWAAAFTLPLTQKSAWLMALGTLAIGLPWSPFAAVLASKAVRDGLSGPARPVVLGWLQTAGACLLVGTVVPGLASAARLPALAGLAVTAAAALDRILAGSVSVAARRAFFGTAALVVTLWVAIAVVGGVQLASAVSYYRGLAIGLIVVGLAAGLTLIAALVRGQPWRATVALLAVAIGLKLAHWGYYVPEWNYRWGQGPWGRAIAQWVPRHRPIYTTHAWPADLAFAIGRPVRQLADPRVLGVQRGADPKFVLLFDNEFAYWPQEAPPLLKVAAFEDEHGRARVLARTAGDASWRHLSQVSREEQ